MLGKARKRTFSASQPAKISILNGAVIEKNYAVFEN